MKKPKNKLLVGQYVTDGRFSGTVSHYDGDGWLHLEDGTMFSPKSIEFLKKKKRD